MSHFSINDAVIVDGSFNGTHDFEARVDHIYPEDSNKFGLIRVVDQDDDAWDVEPDEIRLADSDDEHDQFRTDAEADQDALDSVYGADDGYSASVSNMARLSLDTDGVFGDGWTAEMATATGSPQRGMNISITIGVADKA